MRWILLLLLLVPMACAHLAAGEDIEKNGMFLDFGYAPRVPVVGNMTQIGIVTFNMTNGVTSEATHVEVALSKEGEIVMNETIKVNMAMVDTFFTFEQEGLYTTHITFYDDDNLIVDVQFELPVSKQGKSPLLYLGIVVLTFSGILLLGSAFKKN